MKLSLTASWMPLEFDPTDNDDYAMQQLDKRDSTAMAGVAWYHHERWGNRGKPLRLRTFWITATAGWGAIGIPQNADRSPVLTLRWAFSIMTRISVTITMAFQRVSPVVAVWQVIPRRMPGCPMSA
ncbi:putative scaffolding protein [Escherichia coli]|uniref:Putative scaffolding protein n=1 Tax=Escherichia coli TaxID=562 RepID=A0A3S4KPW1_ECOLX|nr:putative scaffolding protein [Escherichia coli]